MKRSKAVAIREPERGLVPGRSDGIKDKVYGSYLQQLDPRNNLDVQLALGASTDPRFAEFFERIMRKQYQRVSLQTIAKACNITLAEFNKWWQKESSQRAIAVAQTASVIITHDMANDARTQVIACSRCDGLKFIPAPSGLPDDTQGYRMIEPPTALEPAKYIRDCPNCMAEGRISKPGDAHARDKILEMSGLVKKGPGMVLVQNFGGASHASAVTELDDAMSIDVTADEVTDVD